MSPTPPLSDVMIVDAARGPAARACIRLLTSLGAEMLPAADRRQGTLIVTDAPPGGLRALGVSGVGPRVIAVVSAYGLEGPHVEGAAIDPLWSPYPAAVAAELTGAHLALVALAGMRWSRRHKQSLLVETSTCEVLASCLGDRLPRVICGSAGTPAATSDTTRPQIRRCADGWVGVSAAAPADHDDLLALTAPLGLDAWLETRTRAEAAAEAQAWRLPVLPVLTAGEAAQQRRDPVRAVPREELGASASEGRRPPAALPLGDVRVLDLGMVWAGPYCGRLLAALGGHVVKVEGPCRPDGTRLSEEGCCGLFGDLNRGKKSLAIDLGQPGGRETFLRLALTADVVVESFSPRVMPNFGLAIPALHQRNPRLIMLSMPAFPSEGPRGNWVAYGSGLELASGLASWSADGLPATAEVPYLDFLSGVTGAATVVAALLRADRGAMGARYEIAQRDVASVLLPAVAGGGWPSRPRRADPAAAVMEPSLRRRRLFTRPRPGREPCHHYARPPWRLHGIAPHPEAPAPRFGADSRAVLCNAAALDAAEIGRLQRAGVIVDAGEVRPR